MHKINFELLLFYARLYCYAWNVCVGRRIFSVNIRIFCFNTAKHFIVNYNDCAKFSCCGKSTWRAKAAKLRASSTVTKRIYRGEKCNREIPPVDILLRSLTLTTLSSTFVSNVRPMLQLIFFQDIFITFGAVYTFYTYIYLILFVWLALLGFACDWFSITFQCQYM